MQAVQAAKIPSCDGLDAAAVTVFILWGGKWYDSISFNLSSWGYRQKTNTIILLQGGGGGDFFMGNYGRIYSLVSTDDSTIEQNAKASRDTMHKPLPGSSREKCHPPAS